MSIYRQGVDDCPECPDEFLGNQMDLKERECVDSGKQVVVGICAMAKKSNSKPMKEILARLDEFEYIKTVIFPEETILKVRQKTLTTKGRPDSQRSLGTC